MMKHLGKLALVAAVVVMAGAPALAQEQQRQRQRGPGGFGGFGGSPTFLLTQKSVQSELKLSEEQVKKAQELQEKQAGSFRGLRDLSREELQKKMAERREATQKALAGILKPEQVKRLRQISLQQMGTGALNDPEVSKELKITDDQKEKIRDIRTKAFEGQRGQGADRSEEARKKRAEARKAVEEKVMGILTAEQKTKLKELTGEPFKGEITRPQFGGGNRPNGQTRRPGQGR